MLVEQKEENKIQLDETIEEVHEPKEKKHKFEITKNMLWTIIVILLLILYILCYRVGKIGYNYLSIWDVSKVAPIVIKQDDLQITTNTQLNIFSNEKFSGQKVIAPMSKGTFNFVVRNDTNEDVVYHVKFVDEMNNFVNMKYRLKLDNIYIRGNQDKYIEIKELDVEDVILPKDSVSIYTLEWYWESDDEKDTYAGTQKDDQYYTLNLYIFSQAYKS